MTRPEIESRLRELTREAKRLRRLLRGPSRAKQSRESRRRDRIQAFCNAWIEVKRAVNERSGLRCECRKTGGRCPQMGFAHDHFWGGNGRRRSMQSPESVWFLCGFHNEERTLNRPSREWWLRAFEEHVLANGLKSQLPLIARERARIEGKAGTT